MPNARAHATVAALVYAGAALTPYATETLPMSGETVLLGSAVAALAALGPDIDIPGSTISRCLGPLSWLLSWLLCRAFGHRGLIHSALVAAGVCWLAWAFLPPELALAVGWGWTSHILLDCCIGPSGVELWPWGPRLRLGLRLGLGLGR